MITKTVGSGGDYAKWSDAWNYLLSVAPLTDDYEFRQISDVTEDAWPNVSGDTSMRLDVNSKSVRFYCDLADSHQGDVNAGFKTNLSGASGQLYLFWKTNPASFEVENLYIEHVTNTSIAGLLTFSTGSSAIACTATVKNLLLKGYDGSNTSVGVQFNAAGALMAINASNIKIWNCYDGIRSTLSFTTASTLDNRFFENISIKTKRYGFSLSTPMSYIVNFKNCVAYGGNNSTTQDFSKSVSGQSTYRLTNCADSDGSIAGGTTTNVNCITGITSADFESVVSTSSDFLKLPKGDISASPTTNPDRGKSPLSVSFRGNIDYSFPDSLLKDSGIAPTLTTTDLQGNTYGQYGMYPIGCYNVELA